ncbi:DUF3500 domain-containing protein, partial [Kineococcus glutinatus]|uniref:DUF3500 domain-containing protein n=1 Tax=Kineococcus glutinatus TaxID=1070872 RepID=UPI0031EAB9E7
MPTSPTDPARRRHRRPAAAAAAAAALALTLAGCSSSDESGDTTSSSSTTSAGSSSTASAGSGDVVALAEAFAATLDDDQRTSLNQEYTFANASNWSNFPNSILTGSFSMPSGGASGGAMPSGGPGGAMPTDGAMPSGGPGGGGGAPGGSSSTGRVGLQTSELSEEQWTALEDLLRAVTGSAENEGYDEIVQHLEADDYLGDNGGGDDYSRGQYFIAFLGTPSDSGTWELQFGGHHLAVANTYTDGALVSATPSFRGIEPMGTVEVDGDTVQPEQQEQAAYAALLESLDDTQDAAAKLSSTFGDIVLGPGSDWAFPTTSEGVKGSDLTAEQ